MPHLQSVEQRFSSFGRFGLEFLVCAVVSHAMDIEIPSPSVFLRRTPSPPNVPSITKEQVKPSRKEGNAQEPKDNPPNITRRNTQERGVAKPKQSKSRNG